MSFMSCASVWCGPEAQTYKNLTAGIPTSLMDEAPIVGQDVLVEDDDPRVTAEPPKYIECYSSGKRTYPVLT
ncbi:hypothetical protein EXIGLDRAFT_341809 [Exidia glandulosa HHB12029]|uniref:Uncharacterized protein n=1 Tax=Exidia glandulosa HHB12029 TaxID=1314781 RepID=A0A165ZGC5_EXIGL|nr:hypothetical protein EXIGLDRAFT_341809 [Exidia glandulosa HHB12029]